MNKITSQPPPAPAYPRVFPALDVSLTRDGSQFSLSGLLAVDVTQVARACEEWAAIRRRRLADLADQYEPDQVPSLTYEVIDRLEEFARQLRVAHLALTHGYASEEVAR